ncbi:hypothetical protein FZEAL_2647 [Fusarium zealandicum]|uniref:Transmembrane protein n=1 Tax=Fusarium zealandicum TaxID=1053134 RepID=A0A8H4UQB2_9HYPO|nr:hypothetical protein FZEAL_2647 [Fusarium zealandicum]
MNDRIDRSVDLSDKPPSTYYMSLGILDILSGRKTNQAAHITSVSSAFESRPRHLRNLTPASQLRGKRTSYHSRVWAVRTSNPVVFGAKYLLYTTSPAFLAPELSQVASRRAPMGNSCSVSDREAELEPYGDVAGPGVITGFLGTAYFATLLVILHYFIAFNPKENPFSTSTENPSLIATEDPSSTTADYYPNPIDVYFKDLISKLYQKALPVFDFLNIPPVRWLNERQGWHEVFLKTIISMCDIQIVTGFGVLISGFANLHNGISAYHFQLVVLVAWFSHVTHIAGLTVLRQYLYSRPVERLARALAMGLLLVMLITALVPTVYFNWALEEKEGSAGLPGSSARCFYDIPQANRWHESSTKRSLAGTHACQSVVVSVLLISLSFTTRMIKLHHASKNLAMSCRKRASETWVKFILWSIPDQTSSNAERAEERAEYMIHAKVAIMLSARLYSDLLASVLSDVYWLLVSTIWGTMKFFMAKDSARANDFEWTFGQTLPVFLLVAPLLTMMGIVFELGNPKPLPGPQSVGVVPDNIADNAEAVDVESAPEAQPLTTSSVAAVTEHGPDNTEPVNQQTRPAIQPTYQPASGGGTTIYSSIISRKYKSTSRARNIDRQHGPQVWQS